MKDELNAGDLLSDELLTALAVSRNSIKIDPLEPNVQTESEPKSATLLRDEARLSEPPLQSDAPNRTEIGAASPLSAPRSGIDVKTISASVRRRGRSSKGSSEPWPQRVLLYCALFAIVFSASRLLLTQRLDFFSQRPTRAQSPTSAVVATNITSHEDVQNGVLPEFGAASEIAASQELAAIPETATIEEAAASSEPTEPPTGSIAVSELDVLPEAIAPSEPAPEANESSEGAASPSAVESNSVGSNASKSSEAIAPPSTRKRLAKSA